MAPPSYSDLGSKASDILTKGYNFGFWKLDCKTKTSSGIDFNTSAQSNQDFEKLAGSLETKYKISEYGLTLMKKWSTDNLFSTEIAIQDQFVDGLKLAFAGTFAPQSGNKTGKVKGSYGQERFKIDGDIKVDFSNPIINAAAVFGYERWLVGYQTALDVQETKITTNNFALGYTADDTILHAAVNNGDTLVCSVFQKCNEHLDAAAQLKWMSDSKALACAIGAKYVLDNDVILRAKISDEINIGLGYQQKIRQGITLTLSANIDANNWSAHKLGVTVDLEA